MIKVEDQEPLLLQNLELKVTKVMQVNSLVISEEGRLRPQHNPACPTSARWGLLEGKSLEEAADPGSGGRVRADWREVSAAVV